MFGSTFSNYEKFVDFKLSNNNNNFGYIVIVCNSLYDIDFMRGMLTAAME